MRFLRESIYKLIKKNRKKKNVAIEFILRTFSYIDKLFSIYLINNII